MEGKLGDYSSGSLPRNIRARARLGGKNDAFMLRFWVEMSSRPLVGSLEEHTVILYTERTGEMQEKVKFA